MCVRAVERERESRRAPILSLQAIEPEGLRSAFESLKAPLASASAASELAPAGRVRARDRCSGPAPELVDFWLL
jgi:hypothetical protein